MLEFNQSNDLDQLYEMMMDAVDGNLSLADERRLEAYLAKYPDLEAEYRSLAAVNTLFVHTPCAEPPAHFVEATFEQLPNWRARRWLMTAGFLGSLMVGLMTIPVIFVLVFFSAEINQFMALLGGIADAVLNSIGQLLLSGATAVVEYPATMGTLLMMLGSMLLWQGVYQQMVRRPVAA